MKIMIRGILSVFLIFSLVQVHGQKQVKKPNVILIFMDDLGYGDLTSYGALDYQTPIIDKMASEGVRFTNFYAAQAVCSASRAALLTGSYPNRVGIYGALSPFVEFGLNPEEETIADVLLQHGYQTGMVGKWHLGHQEPLLPHHQGFQTYVGLPYSNDMWPVGVDGKKKTVPNKSNGRLAPPLPLLKSKMGSTKVDTIKIIDSHDDQAELTETYTKAAIDFIQENKNKPFFLYLAHSMPHVPIAASKKFKGKSKQGPYGDVLEEIDWSVGEILRTLKKLKIDEQTLVVFLSDNGPWLNYGDHGGNSAGLREGKGTSWEGGMRVPCIVRWPKHIGHGQINNKLASAIDILPTIVQLTGASLPKEKIDGVDISGLFFGLDVEPRTEFYYYYNQNDLEAVRKGSWKLVFPHRFRTYEETLPKNGGYGGAVENKRIDSLALYDLRRDPGERYNVLDLYPDKVTELQKIAEKARADLGDNLTKRPGANLRKAAVIK